MTKPKHAAAVTVLAAAITAITACAQEPVRRGGATAAQAAACRQRSDEVFLTQNRADLYRSDIYATSTRDAPFGSNVNAVPSTGLSQRYAHEQLIDNCLRSVNGNVGDGKAPTPAAPPPIAP